MGSYSSMRALELAAAEGFADTMKQMVANVYSHILAPAGAETPSVFATFADGHRAMLVHEAVLTSAREHRWVAVAAE